VELTSNFIVFIIYYAQYFTPVFQIYMSGVYLFPLVFMHHAVTVLYRSEVRGQLHAPEALSG
jgi:hypothetical protein